MALAAKIFLRISLIRFTVVRPIRRVNVDLTQGMPVRQFGTEEKRRHNG
jgi:hypothetical protein